MSDPRIIDVQLDEATIIWRNADIEQERKIAIFDLIEENHFKPLREHEYSGPYKLNLSVQEGRLVLSISRENDEPLETLILALGRFRRPVRDYFAICDSYYQAIRKATEAAKREMIFVPLRSGRTLHHDVQGRHGAGKVTLRAAPAGTGIIAGGPMRAVFETVGMADVVAKSVGSSNPYNMVRATFDALKNQMHPKDIAAQRGVKYSTLQARRRDLIGTEE